MTATDEREALVEGLAELEEEKVLALVQERLASGADPLDIIRDCQAGMRRVGERYAAGKYYLSGLIMSGEIFREVVELAQPALEQGRSDETFGRVVLGTVQGDIHDIGKNMFAMLLSCYGFSVIDLGVDVPLDDFATRAIAARPDIVGLSGLLTISVDAMRDTVAALRREAARAGLTFPILIGGSQLDETIFRYVGADYWSTEAMDGVRICQRLLGQAPAD
jgi:methanogenic corrinoid protein MtbC1